MADKNYKTEKVYVALFLNKLPNEKVNIKIPIENNDEEDIDVHEIKKLCKSKLDIIEPDIFTNNKKDEVNAKLKDIAEKKAKDFDSFVFFFLGLKDVSPEATDKSLQYKFWDGSMPIEDIYNSVKKSTHMAGKPKLFVFQAGDTRLLPTTFTTKAKPFGREAEVTQRKIPTDADMLIITSTIPQLLANTDHEKFLKYTGFDQDKVQTSGVQPSDAERVRGSFLVQALVDVMLDKSNNNVDILTLTTKMNGKIETLIEDVKKDKRFEDDAYQHILERLELPLTTSTLTKLVVFKQ